MQLTLKLLIAISMLVVACAPQEKQETTDTQTDSPMYIGEILRLEPEINNLVPEDAQMELLAEGFEWSEGPLWVPQIEALILSDIPPNSIYKWSAVEGKALYLKPSGYTQENERSGEVGSNGLILDAEGNLVLCQHGDRRMAKMLSPVDQPSSEFVTLAGEYDGKKLNSPNDAVYHSSGDLYFTDPPYGLEKQVDDPAKELDFQGVFRRTVEGEVLLLTDELSRPNGIAFSPDEKTLYVANSDPERAIWMAYDVNDDGNISNGRVFYDATDQVGKRPGLPDGLKVDTEGNLYATGPGGVWIFNPEGMHLGTLITTQATSNCAFGEDGKSLFITADMYLLRIKLNATGDKM